MKSKFIVWLCVALTVLIIQTNNLKASHNLDGETFKQFCWRNSYGRGVGTVPNKCADDQDRIGLLCYSKCGQNKKRVGFDCHSVCPSGLSDQGLFCRATQYGRGSGYPWKAKDGFSDKGMRKRCQKDNGSGNCQKWGAVYYPKCRQGYSAFGCCICRPNAPNCEALGLGGRFDLSCAKKIDIGDPKTGQCNSDQEKQAGLCYNKCKPGYKGLGPVCWGQAPSNWVQCGMGAAKSTETCAHITFGQVYSVAKLSYNIGTFGAGALATQAATKSQEAKQLSTLQTMYKELKQLYKANQVAIQTVSKTQKVVKAEEATITLIEGDNITAEDITRIAMMIAAILDPSGLTSVASSYTYPKCHQYFP